MNCQELNDKLPLYLYDELPAETLAACDAHVASCASCRATVEEGRRLQALLQQRPAVEPSPALLAECRQALSEALDGEVAPGSWRGAFSDWDSFLSPRPAFRAAGAVAVLALGFGLGWALRSRAPALGPVLRQMNSASISGPDLAGLRIDGISRVAPDPGTGEVRVTLDAARRVTLEGSLDDPRIQQVLVHAVKSYENPGIRRDTLDVLRTRASIPNIRQALLYTMAHDPNPGVRLEALDAVRELEWGPDARVAFLNVLRHDNNPALRTGALGELAKHLDADIRPELERLAAADPSRYVRLRCAAALRELEEK